MGTSMNQVQGFHPPVQERSRKTLERIVEAASRLLARSTFDDISVDDLVAEADSSKGAFYARFDDKEALFEYLCAYWAERAKKSWTEFFSEPARQDEDLPSLLRRIVARLVELYRMEPDSVRAFALRARSPGEPAATRSATDLNEYVLGLVETSVARRADALAHPDPGGAARFGMMAVAAVAREFVLFGNERLRHDAWGDQELIRELSSMFAGYLRVDPDPFVGR